MISSHIGRVYTISNQFRYVKTPLYGQNSAFLGVLGNGMTSRIFVIPVA